MADLTRSTYDVTVPARTSTLGQALSRLGQPIAGFWGALLLLVVVAYIFIPMIAVVLYGLATRWTAHVLPDGYTLQHWVDAFTDERFRVVLLRSLGLAIVTAIIDLLLVTPAAYWQRVRNPRIRPVIELLAAIPFAVPFVVIAFGLLSLSGTYAPSLQGTLWLLVPAHAAIAFSFVYWSIDGSLAAANVVALSEAARTCGASLGATIFRVILPNIGPGMASGAILAFGVSFNEIAMVQILAGDRFETVPLYTLNLLKSTDADFNVLAVMTTVSFIITLLLSIAVVYFNRSAADAKRAAAAADDTPARAATGASAS